MNDTIQHEVSVELKQLFKSEIIRMFGSRGRAHLTKAEKMSSKEEIIEMIVNRIDFSKN